MKKLMIMALMLIGFSISAFAQNWGVGINLGYGNEISKPSLGVKALYDINESFTLAPSFNFYLPETEEYREYESKLNYWDLNLDLHWTCYDDDMYQLYPIVGVTYLNAKVSVDGYNESEGKFGVNLGFGGQMYLTEIWLISAEVKYQIIDNVNQLVPSLSLVYKF